MKKTIILFVVGIIIQQIASAQGTTTYLSNLDQFSTGNDPVGNDSWYAALFYTGNNANGYLLDSVQLEMMDATGSPNGFTIMIYSAIGGAGITPGNNLDTLNGSANPATSGVYTYTDVSSLTLLPNTPYFIVLTAETTIATGAYEWSLTGVNSYNPNGGWAVTGGVSSGVLNSSNGSVSGQSKPARDGQLKSGHFEEDIALSAMGVAQGRDEYTQREPATFDNNAVEARLVIPADCA